MQSYFFVFFVFLSFTLLGQDQSYFQQEVNFEIQVTLDDKAHTLNGQWQMEYTNHSPDPLSFIYIHLWPNAFSDKSSAFAKQKLNFGETKFYFSEEKHQGKIDSLAFTANGQALSQEATNIGLGVIKLILNEPLGSAQKITINSPFRVKIPGSFSRLGRVGQSYQMTQWYPKPAVYDNDGWHPMPYLDYGEYYSEFGSFDVSITLPSNYVVGATGELKNKEEREWLLQKASEDAKRSWSEDDFTVWEAAAFPLSSDQSKTLNYRGENIHDFAWFADKRFYVLHDTIQLTTDNTIDAWSFFTDREAHLWQNSMKYIKRSTHFYSDKVGEYPYPQVTALQSALSAGGGMEYPMITVIGLSGEDSDLDQVIAHEVGHNWFYGVLASNERDHAWMDEGFNSYYEHRYMHQFYGTENTLSPPFRQGPNSDFDELIYRYFACRHMLKAPDTPSGELKGYNYLLGAYSVPSMALQQLEDHIGKERLDNAMQGYFQKWQFKHPQPIDAQKELEKNIGEPLEWLFQGVIETSEIQDYKIKSLDTENGQVSLSIQNNGKITGPFSVVTENDKGEQKIYQIEGFEKEQKLVITEDDYTAISIDPLHRGLDLNKQNNYWHKGWGRFEPPKIKLVSFEKDEQYSNLFIMPLVGFNEHDGLLGGLALYNRTLLPQPFEFALLPFYTAKSKEVNGFGAARYRWWPNNPKIHELSLLINYRQFNFRTYKAESLPLGYQRFSPSIRLDLSVKRKWERSLQLRSIWLNEENLDFNDEGQFIGIFKRARQINELSYLANKKWVLSPVRLHVKLEQSNYVDDFNRGQDYLKLELEAEGKILYERHKAFHWRFFGGLFLNNSLNASTYTPANAFSLFDNGQSDYRYDHLYFDRSATEGVLSQQLANRTGGFRAPVAANFGLGRSNSQMISINISADVPFTPAWLPIKPYVDVASFYQSGFDGGSNQFLWNGGLAMEWLDGKIGIYLPLTGAPEIMDRLKEQGGIAQRFSFRVLLRDLSPWQWIDGIESL